MSPRTHSHLVLDSASHNQIGCLDPLQCSFTDSVIVGQDFFIVTESQTLDDNSSLSPSGLATSQRCSEKTMTTIPSIYDVDPISILRQQLSELKLIEQELRWKRGELDQEFDPESQLGEVRKAHESARRAVETKESEIHEHENLYKPIITLPPEILSLVFRHLISYSERPQSSCQCNAYLPLPLRLASVCRRWRRVILGDPALWTQVNLTHSRGCNLKLYFSRSANLPLTIGFHPTESPLNPWSTVAWDQVVTESHRWGRLCMDLSNIWTDDLRVLLTQRRAGSLTYLSLTDNRERSQHIPLVFASHQNHLHTLILIRFPMAKVLVAPRLQHLTFTASWEDNHPELKMPYYRLRQTLLSATNLQTLALGVLSVTFGEQVQPILLPRLQRLTLYFYSEVVGPQLPNLLDMIHAPALQIIELTTEQGCRDFSDDCNGYPGFMVGGKPRYPTVTTAILHNTMYYREDVESLMKAFPNITRLLINSFAIHLLWGYFRDLYYPPEAQWKDLRDIQLYVPNSSNADFIEFESESLQQILRYRRFQGFRPLNVEVLMDQMPIDVDVEEWWETLVYLCYLTISRSFDVDDTNAPWRFWDAFGSSSRLPRLHPPIRHNAQRGGPRGG